jgi:hypothetical protein
LSRFRTPVLESKEWRRGVANARANSVATHAAAMATKAVPAPRLRIKAAKGIVELLKEIAK